MDPAGFSSATQRAVTTPEVWILGGETHFQVYFYLGSSLSLGIVAAPAFANPIFFRVLFTSYWASLVQWPSLTISDLSDRQWSSVAVSNHQ